jgi:hypothetical protein
MLPLSPRLPSSAVLLIALAGCAGQAEGQRCDKLASGSGDSDCQSGLTCQARMNNDSQSYGICCPQDSTRATTSACSMSTGGISASPTPPDGSMDGAAGGETGADAAAQNQADTGVAGQGSDAPTE